MHLLQVQLCLLLLHQLLRCILTLQTKKLRNRNLVNQAKLMKACLLGCCVFYAVPKQQLAKE